MAGRARRRRARLPVPPGDRARHAERTTSPDLMATLGGSMIPRARLEKAEPLTPERIEYLRRVNVEHESIVEAIERQDPRRPAPRCAPTWPTARNAASAPRSSANRSGGTLPPPLAMLQARLYDVLPQRRKSPAMSPNELKQALSSGLLSFPLTDFDAELRFEPGLCVAPRVADAVRRHGAVRRRRHGRVLLAGAAGIRAGDQGRRRNLQGPRAHRRRRRRRHHAWPSSTRRKPSATAPRACCCCRTT
jgi:hypothetical protein